MPQVYSEVIGREVRFVVRINTKKDYIHVYITLHMYTLNRKNYLIELTWYVCAFAKTFFGEASTISSAGSYLEIFQ